MNSIIQVGIILEKKKKTFYFYFYKMAKYPYFTFSIYKSCDVINKAKSLLHYTFCLFILGIFISEILKLYRV